MIQKLLEKLHAPNMSIDQIITHEICIKMTVQMLLTLVAYQTKISVLVETIQVKKKRFLVSIDSLDEKNCTYWAKAGADFY